MKILLPFALLAAISICGIGEKDKTTTSDPPPANVVAKPAQDRDAVKRQLVSLANEITTAAKDGDVNFLAKATTDDFVFTDIDGSVKSKNKALADVKEERAIKSFEITNENLVSLDESTAVLSYTLKVSAKNGRSARAATTDTYVKKDGKWMLKSEQQTLLK